MFARLRQLHNLELHGNKLTSTIPEAFYDPKSGHSLTRFNVAFNNLSGTISAKISQWKDLRYFVVSQNNLSGELPPEIGLMDLVHVQVNSNRLSGTIPTELGLLTRASTLLLQENIFTGEVPSEIGRLSKLEQLSLFGKEDSNYHLSGGIPIELYSLTNLKLFNLSRQQLTGTIPTIVGNMSSLVEFNLSRNQIEGSIPTELSTIQGLQVLHVHLNKMTGIFPVEVCENPTLRLKQTDCHPVDDPPIPCLCCTACCDRTSGICLKVDKSMSDPTLDDGSLPLEADEYHRYCRT